MRILTILLTTSATPGQTPQVPAARVEAMIDAAEAGAVIQVPAGIYTGNLVIDKPITLEGAGRAVFDAQGEGTVIEIRAEDVVVRGCTVRASASSVTGEPAGIRVLAGSATIEDNVLEDVLFGIDLREAPDSIIRNNTIFGKNLEPGRRGDGIRLWWSHECVIEDNVVYHVRDMVFWYSERLSIARNRVVDSRYGLHFMYSHDTTLADNDLESNSVGIYLMYSNHIRLVANTMSNNRGASGYGIGLKDCDDIVVESNALLANRVGVYVDNSPSSVDSTGLFEGNLFAFNEIGFVATPNTHDNVFTDNTFVENEEQVGVHGRGDLGNNTFSRDGVGNYWSNYAGFDLDNDGIGDLAYEPRSLFSSMLTHEPNLRLFVHSPAQQAIELAARVMPELRPRPLLVDAAPLTRQPALPPLPIRPRSPWLMAAIGTALLGLAGVVLGVTVRFDRLRLPQPGNC